MKTFLHEVAEDLYARYGEGLSERAILFPSRRARLFFVDALTGIAGRPMWQPRWVTVDDLTTEISGLRTGDRVRLITVGGVLADVLAPADKSGNVQVQAGPMKMTVKENELRIVEEQAPVKKSVQPRRDAPKRELNIRSAESEVDVRGMSAQEALFEVDNFLSRALMAGLPSVTVIHGKGTGVLRNAVQQHLRSNKRVKSVRSGVYGEGEQGVTIVELR